MNPRAWLKKQWEKTDLHRLIENYNKDPFKRSNSDAGRYLDYVGLFFLNLFPEIHLFTTGVSKEYGIKFWVASAYSDFGMSRGERSNFINAHQKTARVNHEPKYDFKFKNISVLKIFNFLKPFYIGFETFKSTVGALIDKIFPKENMMAESTKAKIAKAIVQVLLAPIEIPLLIATKVWDIPYQVAAFVGTKIASGVSAIHNWATSRSQPSPNANSAVIDIAQTLGTPTLNNNVEQANKTEQVPTKKGPSNNANTLETTPEQSPISPNVDPRSQVNHSTFTIEDEETDDELAIELSEITTSKTHTNTSHPTEIPQPPVGNTAQMTKFFASQESNNNSAPGVNQSVSPPPPSDAKTENNNSETRSEMEKDDEKEDELWKSTSITSYSVLGTVGKSSSDKGFLEMLRNHANTEESGQTQRNFTTRKKQ